MEKRDNSIKMDATKLETLGIINYNRPYTCKTCGGMMIFKGVGEYQCEECQSLDYDDYGKARNYIEGHPGATSSDISAATGVSQRSIRHMLKESRLEIAPDSRTFMKCEICGANIRHGSLCDRCETAYHRNMEDQERTRRELSGYGMERDKLSKGEKRFHRTESNI